MYVNLIASATHDVDDNADENEKLADNDENWVSTHNSLR